jgi:LmbE family N-acetylglucosaminyl deacetylase
MYAAPILSAAASALTVILLLGCNGSEQITSPSLPSAVVLSTSAASYDDFMVDLLANKRVLWVAPHPDDELHTASLLGEVCVHRGATCTLFTLTRGDGWCPYVTSGEPCGDVRIKEMQASAAVLNAQVIQWALPNLNQPTGTTKSVEKAWVATAGTRKKLVDKMAAVIRDVGPDVVITQDPRHGSTCHPEHRVAARLIRDALPASKVPAVLYHTNSRSTTAGFTAYTSQPELITYDATRLLPDGKTAWDYFAAAGNVYESQYSAQERAGAYAVPLTGRRGFYLPSAAVPDPNAIAGLCTNP